MTANPILRAEAPPITNPRARAAYDAARAKAGAAAAPPELGPPTAEPAPAEPQATEETQHIMALTEDAASTDSTTATPPLTEIQFREIRRGDLIRITESRVDASRIVTGRAAVFNSGWRTDTGTLLVADDGDPTLLTRTIELVERPEREGLPQEPGSVIIATLVLGFTGEWPMFRGRTAWQAGQPIDNGWLFQDVDIQEWRPATIVEDVLP